VFSVGSDPRSVEIELRESLEMAVEVRESLEKAVEDD
jgi:hypothetical protein